MSPRVHSSRRSIRAAFMLALSWLAMSCGGEVSEAEGDDGSRRVGLATCDRLATNAATLASQWSAATAGQTICLASGSYGTFSAGAKPGVVTVKPQSGATPTLALRFNGANNVRIEGLTLTSAVLLGSTRNVTITGSRFTGAAMIDGVAQSNILFDGNTHLNINAPTGAVPARIHLPYSSSTHSGVTIQNSRFEGGDADGIQTGVGVNILNNQFKDIQENGPNHTDAIQLLGAPGAVVRGNYFLNCASGIVAYDGVERAVIEDNVLDLRGRPWAIELYSDDGSIVRHNTLQHGACDWNLPCGIIDITRKTADDVGRGTVIVDNVATEISVNNGSTVAERHHNLLRQYAQSGELTGVPVFMGGAAPTDWSGFRLAPGSPGKSAASDGTDIGIR
ncbi:right-handed parallel beta-helix repeat-containing protein [Corallococcus llansteffanensis]|uniref:right-handed parallel beta-helix repeat-containing protein n=1 Tax=Corallococcus llansteffanensis TaxID=2316731 RepID=UPI001FC9FC1B|nr:right-handed parallel beta-helix repeat-containing protein [Corallococcus llansteffanensis]